MKTPDAARAPTLDDLEAIAAREFAALPEGFRQMCQTLVIHVDEFADENTLRALGIEDPFELTGLYEGVDVTEKSLADPAPQADRVFLFRRPLIDEWADRGDVTLEELVRHVLIHEIGHHFGLSDEAMDEIDRRP